MCVGQKVDEQFVVPLCPADESRFVSCRNIAIQDRLLVGRPVAGCIPVHFGAFRCLPLKDEHQISVLSVDKTNKARKIDQSDPGG